ncbi:unnamed protein product [Lepeophtheirus salmonis]|nr:unnamed protein product [Lepeophtheirus salmonis]CAF2945178.1 unnamed protein product [Lepeophtheirus salmonis]
MKRTNKESVHADETNNTAEVRGNDIVEVHGDDHDDVGEVGLEMKIEYDHDVDEADPPQITEEQNSNINLKDIGMWPAMFNYNIREMLKQQGSKAVKNIDCEFKEVWKELEIRLFKGKTMDNKHQHLIKNTTDKLKQILSRLLDIIMFLTKQNLALRGYREHIRVGQLEMDDINIRECRGKAFDNAAVVAGHRSASTYRWYILIEITGVTIKGACEMRWSSRSDPVKVIHTKFTEVITALERLMEDVENATTRSDAGFFGEHHFLKMKAITQPLNVKEWNEVLDKMMRYHANISEEIKVLVQTIRKEMQPDLIPIAEDKANYGKIIKQAIRSMWALEYEIDDLQGDFAKNIGSIDIQNLTDDFVEDVMLQSKPLQAILFEIRTRQKTIMDDVKTKYSDKFKDLEPLTIKRPSKPMKKPEGEKKEETKPAESEKPKEEAKVPEEVLAEQPPVVEQTPEVAATA